MFGQIIQAIIALPKLIEEVKSISAFLNGVFGDSFAKFSGDTSKMREQLEKINSSEEAKNAARQLSDILSRIK